MTEEINNKPKKLVLNKSNRLALSNSTQFTSNTSGSRLVGSNSRTNTIVEVKKSRTISSLSTDKSVESRSEKEQDDSGQLNQKLTSLKQAADDLRSDGAESKITGLSKLVEINNEWKLKLDRKLDQESSSENELNPDVKNDNRAGFGSQKEGATSNSAIYNKFSDSNAKRGFKNDHVLGENDLKAYNSAKADHLGDKNANSNFTSSAPGSSKNAKAIVDEDDARGKRIDSKLDKTRLDHTRKFSKSALNILGEEGSEELFTKTRSLASIKRAKEKERRKHFQQIKPEKVYREVTIPETIVVSDLASQMSERVADVIRELMKLGIIATAQQTIDADTAEIVATTLGHTVKRVQDSDIENILSQEQEDPAKLQPRPPVVAVMGHVDHGKTSLLDALKSTDVASKESGGITQHIGAYQVKTNEGKLITFLDTPGHEAFSEMRARGSKVTDIVILVVAADDGIKAQTIEAINHAKAANVPIIVAVNKIDRVDVNIERIKHELLAHDLVSEDLGGDVIMVPISALKKTNLDKLLDAVLLVAEMQNLLANPDAKVSGAVIESKIDKGKGPVATLLVERGTLRIGDIIVVGTTYAKVKAMRNDKNTSVASALPSQAIEVYGLETAPNPGDRFDIVNSEKQARDIAEYRFELAKQKKVALAKASSLDELFAKSSGNHARRELNLIVKCDFQGSCEAIAASVSKIGNDEVGVRILHQAVGAINESDVMLASSAKALILGFNVRMDQSVSLCADQNGVDVRYYSIIYNLIDDVKAILSGMLSPIIREQFIGSVEIRQIFNISKAGKIAGSYVTKGIIKRGAGVRLIRDNIVVHEGKLKTLKRFKDDVKEVRESFECGIAFENYDNIQVGDMVEVFELVSEQRKLS